MEILAQNSYASLNISSEITVLQYTYTGDSIKVITRVDIGKVKPLALDVSYEFSVYINSVKAGPENPVDSSIMTSPFSINSYDVLNNNDTIKITIKGSPSDTDVDCSVYLYNELSEIENVSTTITNALSSINVRNERTILGPIRPCVRQFTLPVCRN